MSTSSVPQCLTCRKRQVKCDSVKPTCARCERDGRECRGYERPLKFVSYKPQERRRRKPGRQRSETYPSTQQLDSTSPSSDLDYLALLESFRYYEIHVLRQTIPSQRPFRRNRIDRNVPWHVIPRIVQHCMIVALRSIRADVNAPNTTSRQDLCRYRGQSLSALQKMIPEAVRDPYGVALGCVILLMGADMQLFPTHSWLVHFEAAQRITHLRGGIKKTLETQPQSRNILLNFVVADILTGATCNSQLLNGPYSCTLEYNELLPHLGTDLIARGCICPVPILQGIAGTNVLRGRPANAPTLFASIQESIKAFNPAIWAQSIMLGSTLEQGPLPSELSGLTDLARCYQLAAMLYLSLSDGVLGEDRTLSLEAMKQTLAETIRSLCEMAGEDLEGPLQTHLWKHISWPLFVSAFVQIGWPYTAVFSGEDIFPAFGGIEMVRTMAAAMGSTRLSTAADHLCSVQFERSGKTDWTWDDGFAGRYAFAL